ADHCRGRARSRGRHRVRLASRGASRPAQYRIQGTVLMKTKPIDQAASLRWPLMKNNIAREDLDAVCALLNQEDPVLTQSRHVRAFEEEWSDWLGVRYSIFVNSGSSANLVTLAVLRELHGPGGEVIVPTITWVSDIAAVLHCGFEPVFVDLDPRTLGMDNEQVLEKIT